MQALLPSFFIALTGLCLVLVLWALRRSLAVLLHPQTDPLRAPDTDAGRQALLAEKRALLQTLRDLTFERETGKISDADFERLDARYRARAKEVLRSLDDALSDYRAQAEALVAAARGAAPAPSKPAKAAPAAVTAEPARKACGECGTDNEADAVFCKKCGARWEVVTETPS